MEKRIYLATKANTTLGVDFNITKNKALLIPAIQYNTNQTGFAGIRECALYALVEELKKVKEYVAEVNRPVYIYVIKALHDVISNGTYKYWILTGTKSNGELIPEEEMKLWIEFHTLYSELGLYVHIKDIFTCKLPKNSKYRPDKLKKAGDVYSRSLWDKLSAMGLGDNIAEIEE